MVPRVLLIGGHGKISQLLTPILLSRSYQITSLVRDPSQKPTITALGKGLPGQLDVLVHSIETISSLPQAQNIIDSAKPDYIVFSAGAGGKGGPARTEAIDQTAAIAFIRAAAFTQRVKKFILVSYVGSRRNKAPWWSEEEWKSVQEVNNGPLKNYYPAKLAADEVLMVEGRKKGDGFAGVSLRPGTLTEKEAEGRVALGKIGARGKVGRGDVARVIAEVLQKETGSCWLDLLEGDEGVQEAVERVVRDEIDCVEGEDIEGMMRDHA